MKRLALLASIAALALWTTSACGRDGSGGPPPPILAERSACARDQFKLEHRGLLTIGTANPARSPWFGGGTNATSRWELNDPSTGKGFESAVVYAVAAKMDFERAHVQWVVAPLADSLRPGEKPYDFAVNHIVVTRERDLVVDFSDSYYDVSQALIARDGTALADAGSIEELKSYRFGVQAETSSQNFVRETILPDEEPRVYDTAADVAAGFNANEIDGIIVDLPNAFTLVDSGRLERGVIAAQFPPVEGEAEHFGMLFEEQSLLRPCVNEVLTELRDEGTLDEIEREWLSEATLVPMIE